MLTIAIGLSLFEKAASIKSVAAGGCAGAAHASVSEVLYVDAENRIVKSFPIPNAASRVEESVFVAHKETIIYFAFWFVLSISSGLARKLYSWRLEYAHGVVVLLSIP